MPGLWHAYCTWNSWSICGTGRAILDMTFGRELMDNAIVSRIRPISWKICVQGREEAEYVRVRLAAVKMTTTELERDRDLADPPVYSFVASYRHDSPLISE